jgi:hypothetical protein
MLAFLSTIVAPQESGAQTAVLLRPPAIESRRDFERIVAVRELRDGSLLVADKGQERLLSLTSFEHAAVNIGRIGSGPNEYRAVGGLWALGGDSSLFVDGYSGRWLILNGARIVGQVSESRPAYLLLRARSLGASASGEVVGARPTRHARGVPRTFDTADSLAILRVSVTSDRVDTIASIAGHGGRGFTRIPARDRLPEWLILYNPASTAEQALLFPDGWLAIVRRSPYRVDWRRADGTWLEGSALPEPKRPLTPDEQCAAISRLLPVTRLRCDPTIFPGWPADVSPVRSRLANMEPTVLALPMGRIAIARTPALNDARAAYDVVDRRSTRVGTIVLGIGEVLVGSSQRHAYVTHTDEDGLQSLRRYDWPREWSETPR